MSVSTRPICIDDIRIKEGEDTGFFLVKWHTVGVDFRKIGVEVVYDVVLVSKINGKATSFIAGKEEIFHLSFTNSQFLRNSLVQINAYVEGVSGVIVKSDLVDISMFLRDRLVFYDFRQFFMKLETSY
eukprot:TRINITY_DN5489_c0_g1_i3.p1 TRINITY_DN5489_c0_g1~~TRINITY_DN5489_c0_g1_i3.p1  ORF type:complete len:128 (+),score=14.12 TRINITY_DN5489_c0_g1_i3:262-645(+)